MTEKFKMVQVFNPLHLHTITENKKNDEQEKPLKCILRLNLRDGFWFGWSKNSHEILSVRAKKGGKIINHGLCCYFAHFINVPFESVLWLLKQWDGEVKSEPDDMTWLCNYLCFERERGTNNL